MNKICNDYCKMINNNFSKNIQAIIIYGSNIYNESTSDLDVCLIVNENNSKLQKEIIKKTLLFHNQKKLKIDNEIPHTNKLIYTIEEIEESLNNPPFFENGQIVIHDIIKNKKFLSSKEMKQRLILNILTTEHLTVGKNIINYEKKALKLILNVVINYFEIESNSEDEILECMYTNKFTGASGEMYLGYKKKSQEKEKYLKRKVSEALND